jgi:hypothetical protein
MKEILIMGLKKVKSVLISTNIEQSLAILGIGCQTVRKIISFYRFMNSDPELFWKFAERQETSRRFFETEMHL